jgi:cytochrome subunit of sulfide dehydrogenase
VITNPLLRTSIVLIVLATPARAADSELGKRLGQSCIPCHGSSTSRDGIIPPIAGTDERTLNERLMDLRAGESQAAIMPRLLRLYTEAEIAALARYFSAVKK